VPGFFFGFFCRSAHGRELFVMQSKKSRSSHPSDVPAAMPILPADPQRTFLQARNETTDGYAVRALDADATFAA
jgi:hypothetical protein